MDEVHRGLRPRVHRRWLLYVQRSCPILIEKSFKTLYAVQVLKASCAFFHKYKSMTIQKSSSYSTYFLAVYSVFARIGPKATHVDAVKFQTISHSTCLARAITVASAEGCRWVAAQRTRSTGALGPRTRQSPAHRRSLGPGAAWCFAPAFTAWCFAPGWAQLLI